MAKAGLILEGGGMRGSYTAGVLDAFLDLGIHSEDIIGVSAGAANAISYVSEQQGRNLTIYNTCINRKYLSAWNFLTTGSFFGMKYVFYEVTRNIIPFDYDTFKNSRKKLTIVATNVKDGKPFYKQLSDLNNDADMKYLCATAAIPMASTIVKVDGHQLMDGGASDSIPIEYSLSKGNTKNIIVLTRCAGFRHEKGKMNWFPYIRYPSHREFAYTIANRYQYYNKSIEIAEQQEREGNALIIRPSRPIIAGRMEKNPKKLSAQYQVGYDDTMAMRDKLLVFADGLENVDLRK
ncbi:patatin-like phospholipase family protein [Christensenella tenuis]|uniref:Patatin family protein n=1 Tax=Christensenella tenuis TaxID=2763033 RepID=A0ABR7EB21_9FIRM|nr:patatin family protein [Christensenella tenuis]MBC5646962.1 patatin family protein [Christensenella tenuis]